MCVSLETVSVGTVTPFFFENRARYAKRRIFGEFTHQKLEIILLKREICIEIPDDFIVQMFYPLIAGIEAVDFRRETSIPSERHFDQLHPAVCPEVFSDN